MVSSPGLPSNRPLDDPETQVQPETNRMPRTLISGDPVLRLRLIATSDLHACLLPYDYCANLPLTGRGLDEVARQIAVARAEAPNNLLFDNGDFLQGNPLADFVASVERRRRAHPMITAFNELGYDAVTLGNHDFDYGLGFLSKSLGQARFPVISANVATRFGKTPDSDQTLVPPFAILQRRLVDEAGRMHDLRIGVIGFAPAQLQTWTGDSPKNRIQMRDILTAAKAWLPRIKAAGADLIVALAHSGIGPLDPDEGTENMATALAALPEIDAVIAGHSHQIFPGPDFAGMPGVDPVHGCLAGKPAVMPGHSGSHLGIIDLVLTRPVSGRDKWEIADHEVRLLSLPATASPATSQFRRSIAPDHRAVLAWSRRSLGQTRVPLTTYFATTAPSAVAGLIAAAKIGHARRALAGTALARLPLLASVSPFRAGGHGGSRHYSDIPVGQFRMRNLSDIYPFQNSLVTLAMTAADAGDWLERSALVFRQISPGDRDVPLHDPRFPSFAFDCIPGLDYAVDLSQPLRFDLRGKLIDPDARRIVGLSLNGRPLDPDEPLLLVTDSHRAGRVSAGISGMPQVALADGVRMQAVLAEYIRDRVDVGEPPRRNWHFLPMPGTSVTIATGEGAANHLADIAPMRPEFLRRDAEGFLHYRLHL